MPKALCALDTGEIVEHPSLPAAARTGDRTVIPARSEWIGSPFAADYYTLPHHTLPGCAPDEKDLFRPVAACLPPGYVRLYLPAGERRREDKRPLPQIAYCAAGWRNGSFAVTAERVDYSPYWDPKKRDAGTIGLAAERFLKGRPKNRLVRHLTHCSLRYNCYTAQNLLLRQGEGGIPVSTACNASCIGCISFQPAGGCPSAHDRIAFTPTVEEIAELAVPHLQKAPQAIISFGQGCEGEPTLREKLLIEAIRAIRKETSRGTIHINTNGSRPDAIERLAHAGLQGIRVSINSARKPLYDRYYRPDGYSFNDVLETLRRAKGLGLFVSVNLLVFPGVTDRKSETVALLKLFRETRPDLIQLRNLNIDPDLYMRIAGASKETTIGVKEFIRGLREEGFEVGCFNRPAG